MTLSKMLNDALSCHVPIGAKWSISVF